MSYLAAITGLKTFLHIEDDDQDDFLTSLAARASAKLDTYLGRTIEAAAYTEYYDGDGTGTLLLKERPVNSLTTLTVDGVAVDSEDWHLYAAQGRVVLVDGYDLSGTFTKGIANVYAAYNAGYASVPADLQAVCTELAALMFQDSAQGANWLGKKSETLPSGAGTLALMHALCDMSLATLDRYRRIAIG